MNRHLHLGLATAGLLLFALGCDRDNDSTGEPIPQPSDHEVFLDGFGPNLDFQAFGESDVYALSVVYTDTYQGDAALKIAVPDEGGVNGSFAGGAFVTTNAGRNLTEYDALTFWAKASTDAVLNVIGMGNNNAGTSLYEAASFNLPVSTSWQKYIFPLPLPEKLSSEQGLFQFAIAPNNGVGFDVWFDEVQYEQMDGIGNTRPAIVSQTINTATGSVIHLAGSSVTFDVDGVDQTVGIAPAWLEFASTNEEVVTPDGHGGLSVVGSGTATITASLGTVAAEGAVTILAMESPTAAAPTPTHPASEVISLFSNVYANEAVDSWSADWDIADVEDIQIEGDDVKLYTNLAYAGIDFSSNLIDASEMGFLHVDVYTFDPSDFRIKLVDFGADGAYQGGDDSEDELSFSTSTYPAMVSGDWSSLEIPLTMYSGLAAKSNLSQVVISGGSPTVYIDNLYFHEGEAATSPQVAAPMPVYNSDDVVGIYSDAYDCITVDTWSAEWDMADQSESMLDGNNMLVYENLTFAGIEMTSSPVDASSMNSLHLDLWTADNTSGASFRIKLVDAGDDGVLGTGDDSEHEVIVTDTSSTPLLTGTWVSIDLLLQTFTDLAASGHIAQLILSSDPLNTVYIDNIYFHNQGVEPGTPEGPAPVPTEDAAEVISLFSDVYEDVPVSTWSAEWDQADLLDTDIQGDAVKLYSNLTFVGIEFTDPTIDISDKSHFHMDIWTPDEVDASTVFKIKLVDFGPNGVWEGPGVLDDTEHELSITAAYTTPLASGSWVSLDLPLSEYTGLVTRQHLAQLILSGGLSTVYIDNIYFHGTGGSGNSGPESPAPDPTWAAADVISLFSDVYTNVTVDTWSANWPDEADVAQVEIDGNAVKLYTSLTYAGIEFTSQTIDASEMTHFHFNLYTEDNTDSPVQFWVKLVDFGANGVWGGGDDVEHQIFLDASSSTPLESGVWLSYDLPLSDFTGLVTQGHMAQLLIGSGVEGANYIDTCWIDNVLFHR